jgi:hypothetical protein
MLAGEEGRHPGGVVLVDGDLDAIDVRQPTDEIGTRIRKGAKAPSEEAMESGPVLRRFG